MKTNSILHPFGVFLEGTFSILLFTVYIIATNITRWGMMEWNKGIEKTLITGGIILFIGALPFYLITIKLFKVVGNARTLSYGPIIFTGALLGLIWVPLFKLGFLLKGIVVNYIYPSTFIFYLLTITWILGATLSALIISLFIRIKSARHDKAFG